MVVIGGIAIGVKAIIAASAVLCIAFIILCYPALKTAIQEIRRSIQGFFKECKKRVLSYWEKRRKSQRLHIHHIVAKADKRAKKSQDILENVGITVSTDERNLVPLKDRFHQRLHTNAYFEAVDACLFGKNDIVQVSNTLFALKTILAIINIGA